MRVNYSYLDQQFADPEPYLDGIRDLVKRGDFTLGGPVLFQCWSQHSSYRRPLVRPFR